MRDWRTLALVACLLLSVSVRARAQSSDEKRPDAEQGIEFEWGVKIPVRDGAKLGATVYRPKGAGRLPVVFTLTPYIGDTYHERAMYFARNGYVFALVDVRGRGNSEGSFEPFANDARDGHDVIEWLARQPWSDGKVTMWGGSYAGFDQWAALKEFPAHLRTIVPVASAHPAVDFPFFKNIFTAYDIQWLTYTSGATPNANLFREGAFWTEKFRELYLNHRPYAELDKIVGNTSSHFQTWLKHPTPDAYWDAMAPTIDDYKRIDIPILSITGHYDGDQRGALEYYRRHMTHGTPAAKEKHFLIIGPWDHAGTRTPRREVGGLRFGERSLLDMNKLHREWYDWTLKSGQKPEFLKDRVAYYVVGPGAENWKYAPSLDRVASERRTLYLDSDGRANDPFRSGSLSAEKPPPRADAPSDAYTYDPLDVRPAEREDVPNFLLDQRAALNLDGNGLVFHSAPFPEATEVTGVLKFVAWMSLDVPDTDFAVDVYEIQPDGTSVFLTDDMMRARYREDPRRAKAIKPGEINEYVFDAFQFFSRRVQKGSRLRLVLRSPNSTGLQKNYNGGGDVSRETAKDARTAHVRLYHDHAHPSRLEIPIVK
jgi:putative CocE/NonD family hydrolase